MKGRVHYKSDFRRAWMIFMFVVMCLWFRHISKTDPRIPFVSDTLINETFAGYFLIMLPIAVMMAGLVILSRMPCSYEADSSAVSFRRLYERIYIPYDTIRSISLSNDYCKPKLRGDHPYFREVLTIECEDDTYTFYSDLDIDLGAVARYTGSFQSQSEHGAFFKLEKYIKEQMYI